MIKISRIFFLAKLSAPKVMEYQKIINLLDNTRNQPSNDDLRGTYNNDNLIRFKTSMLRSSLYDYSDAYILVKGTTIVAPATTAAPNNANKKVILKNCAPFTNCISRINNTQVDDAYDDAYDIDVVMLMYDLKEHSDDYSKTYGILWQYCKDEPALGDNDAIVHFTIANVITDLLKK